MNGTRSRTGDLQRKSPARGSGPLALSSCHPRECHPRESGDLSVVRFETREAPAFAGMTGPTGTPYPARTSSVLNTLA